MDARGGYRTAACGYADGRVCRGDLRQHQHRLARLHLAKGCYLRAAILGNEAVLAPWMAARGEGGGNRQADRERPCKGLLAEMGEARRDAGSDDCRTPEALVSALVHGPMPEWRRTRDLLQSPARLGRVFERLRSRLLT